MTTPLPPDDPTRRLVVARRDAPGGVHLAVAGGTYTILVRGEDTAGRYCLVDMHVPPGGGPPPHRHDFEELFTVLDGEVTFTFRGAATVAAAGTTVNVPANAPHAFTNASGRPARMLCLCSPAGQDEFFRLAGEPVAGFADPAPPPDPAAAADRRAAVEALAARFRIELLPPG